METNCLHLFLIFGLSGAMHGIRGNNIPDIHFLSASLMLSCNWQEPSLH